MRVQKTFVISLVLVAAGMLFLAAYSASFVLKVQDLAEYWSAAHLVRENPYSESLVTSFERSFGYSKDAPAMVIRNPPSALAFILPLRFMSYNAAFAFWTLFSFLVVAGCARAWSNTIPALRGSLLPVCLWLLFGPTIILFTLGQIVVLDLLGITLFLIAIEGQRDWLAGLALSLACVKPHIILLLLLVVVLWSVRNKRWAVLISMSLSIVGTTALALLLNPHIMAQYIEFAGQFASERMFYPNLGGLLFQATGQKAFAYLPQLGGLVWLFWYWWKHRNRWSWSTHAMLVLLVSVMCSYYSFPFDEIVVLPALMTALAKGNSRVFLAAYVLTDLGFAFYLTNFGAEFGFNYMFLWWSALGWLATYLLAQSRLVAPKPQTL